MPGRNLLFFTYAAALAYRRGMRTLVGGMCETDFSGYPDCRNDTLQTLAKAISLGTDAAFIIETPLMWIDKAGTWALAEELGGAPLVELIVEESHTCYLGIRSRRHAWGYGCGHCPACALRAKGWEAWQAARRADPRRRCALSPATGRRRTPSPSATKATPRPTGCTPCCTRSRATTATPATGTGARRIAFDEFADPQAELAAIRDVCLVKRKAADRCRATRSADYICSVLHCQWIAP